VVRCGGGMIEFGEEIVLVFYITIACGGRAAEGSSLLHVSVPVHYSYSSASYTHRQPQALSLGNPKPNTPFMGRTAFASRVLPAELIILCLTTPLAANSTTGQVGSPKRSGGLTGDPHRGSLIMRHS
jgi:hypothetical protein